MEALKHVDEDRHGRNHRLECEFVIDPAEFVGVRGGRKIPLEIVWKPSGYGLGTSVFRICGCAILFPHVRYHNGNEKPRTMAVCDWVTLTKIGSWKMGKDHSKEFKAKLEACEAKKSKYSGRMFEIVSSILEDGGTLSITNR